MPGLLDLTDEQRAAGAAIRASRRANRMAAGVPGLKDAIKAKCADCIYDPLAGGSCLAQITACTDMACPIWPHRPGAESIMPADYQPRTYAGVSAAIREQAETAR